MNDKNNTIFFSGGGTLGSVMPLLGFYEDLKDVHSDYKYIWIGTENGPEKDVVQKIDGVEYCAIKSGKFRRYLDIKNVLDVFNIIIGFIQSINLIKKNKPKIILTAGGFVCVPLCLAARLFKIPFFVHQQDYEVGLANKIMARFSNVVTVVLNKSLEDYSNIKTNKIIRTGNLIKQSIFNFSREEALSFFSIKSDKKILLVTGGGTGAEFINNLVLQNLDNILENYEVIHLAGKGKNLDGASVQKDGYHFYEFLSTEMKMALNIADVVVSRAGFSALTEICALKKPLILIPLPGHQDLNAKLFEDKAIVLYQNNFDNSIFLENLKKLSIDESFRKEIGEKITSVIEIGNDKYMKLVEEYL